MPRSDQPGEPRDATTMARIVKGARGALGSAVLERLRSAGAPTLRAAHLAVFDNLEPDGVRLTALAERAGMSHQAMGELVAELEALRYVERVADPDDRRSRRVRPTPAGRALVAAGRQYLEDVRADWQRALGADLAVDEVLGALEALLTILSTAGQAAPAVNPRRPIGGSPGAADR